MSVSTFATLDTNILFRVVTQGQSGCEFEQWQELQRLAEKGSVILIIPELVLLEFEKKTRELELGFDSQFTRIETALKEALNKQQVWNEAAGLIHALKDGFNQWKTLRLTETKSREEQIWAFLRSKHVMTLPFDQEIHFRAYRRQLAGKYPKQEGKKQEGKKQDADCCIVESLIRHFEGRDGNNQFLLCTENLKDFGVKTDDGKGFLHPLLTEGFPPTEIFTDLVSLVACLKELKLVEEPAPDELNEALEREIAEGLQREIELEEAIRTGLHLQQRLESVLGSGAYDPQNLKIVATMREFFDTDERQKRLLSQNIDTYFEFYKLMKSDSILIDLIKKSPSDISGYIKKLREQQEIKRRGLQSMIGVRGVRASPTPPESPEPGVSPTPPESPELDNHSAPPSSPPPC